MRAWWLVFLAACSSGADGETAGGQTTAEDAEVGADGSATEVDGDELDVDGVPVDVPPVEDVPIDGSSDVPPIEADVCVPDPRCGAASAPVACSTGCGYEGSVYGTVRCCVDDQHRCYAHYTFDPCTAEPGSCPGCGADVSP